MKRCINNEFYSHLALNFPLAKLYSNSLMSSLNSRAGWRFQTHDTTDNKSRDGGMGTRRVSLLSICARLTPRCWQYWCYMLTFRRAIFFLPFSLTSSICQRQLDRRCIFLLTLRSTRMLWHDLFGIETDGRSKFSSLQVYVTVESHEMVDVNKSDLEWSDSNQASKAEKLAQ